MRHVYRWTAGVLSPTGYVSEAHLRAWEYEVACDTAWQAPNAGEKDDVRLWKTRRPDLAPEELWVGERDVNVDRESAS